MASDSRIHVVHVITDLMTGGAEMALARLIGGMDQRRFRSSVVSLTGKDELGADIEAMGVPVHALGMRRGRTSLPALLRLARLLRELRPALLQTWLYHADLAGTIAAWLAGVSPVVWNLRCSDMDLAHYSPVTRWTVRALALGSRMPAAVVVNSDAGRTLHQRAGYKPRRWEVIANGFDLERFRPDREARRRLTRDLGIDEDAVLVANVARVDPMKDHAGLLEAAARVAAERREAHFLLIGAGTAALAPAVSARGLHGRVHLLGPRRDVERILPGVDMLCLSSLSEGFPNALGEAMACGVPCVTTDAGDCRQIVGDTGLVVPRRDPAALAGAVLALIDRGRQARAEMGLAARARIAASYSSSATVDKYQQLYGELSRPSPGCGAALL